MAVEDCRGQVDELAVIDSGLLAQHLESACLVDAVALHEYPLGSLCQGAAPECALEVLVLGEAPEHDVDRALPVLNVGVADVSENALLEASLMNSGWRAWSRTITGAGGFPHDLVDQREGML